VVIGRSGDGSWKGLGFILGKGLVKEIVMFSEGGNRLDTIEDYIDEGRVAIFRYRVR
jgi:hypothetical protein